MYRVAFVFSSVGDFLAFPAHSRFTNTTAAGTGNSGYESARQFEPCVSERTLRALANRRALASPEFAADQSHPLLEGGGVITTASGIQFEQSGRAPR